jgi:hypothetical protein
VIVNQTARGLEQLDALLGDWTITSKKFAQVQGRQTIERIENGSFVRLQAHVDDDRFPATTQIISSDDSGDECTCLYYDSRGVHRIYQMSVVEGVWKIWRNAPDFNQRYVGTISDDGNTIAGQWESSNDGKHWAIDFDLTFQKSND